MSKGGKRDNAGRKPLWDVDTIRLRIREHTETWWTQIGKMMTSKNPGERKFALSEFNKLQVKSLPQQVTGGEDEDGQPLPILIHMTNVPAYDRNKKDISASEAH